MTEKCEVQFGRQEKAALKETGSIDQATINEAKQREASSSTTTPPSYQKVQRGGTDKEEDDDKTCRICLQDDYPQDMIAPCKCKGGSKWVHRQCLDQWRVHETDRAFSKCTECLFDYHLQPKSTNSNNKNHLPALSARTRLRMKYTFLVSRDLCVATVTMQFFIVALGCIVSWADSDRKLPLYLNPDYPVAVYYLFGFLALLILLGIVGCMMLCSNGCSVEKSLEPFPEVRLSSSSRRQSPNNDTYQPSYAERSSYYRERREQNQNREPERFCHYCTGCCYSPPPYYYGDASACCCCCDGDDMENGAAVSRGASNTGGGGVDCCNGGADDGCGEVILIVLVVMAIFLAIVGFLVGIVLVVIIFQRTSQRHIYILHKRQLATEFQVMDLADYNLEQPITPTTSRTIDEESYQEAAPATATKTHPPLPEPTLEENDVVYLKNLGLKE